MPGSACKVSQLMGTAGSGLSLEWTRRMQIGPMENQTVMTAGQRTVPSSHLTACTITPAAVIFPFYATTVRTVIYEHSFSSILTNCTRNRINLRQLWSLFFQLFQARQGLFLVHLVSKLLSCLNRHHQDSRVRGRDTKLVGGPGILQKISHWLGQWNWSA